MAKLINGNGNPAVYASEDSDWFSAIMGNVTSITAIGEQFRYDQADANTIEVFDGVIITKEGRRIQLDVNQVDLFEIPTGTQGETSYYIIGYHLVTDADSNQACETFVQKMEDGTETIPENTFRGGADDVYVSLYRVTQDGLNIDSIDLLLPSISSISQIKSDLTANSNHFYFDYKDGKYGYNTDPSRGAGTFSPFKSGLYSYDFDFALCEYDSNYYFAYLTDRKAPSISYFRYDSQYTNTSIGGKISISKPAGYPDGHNFTITYNVPCTRYLGDIAQHFNAGESETLVSMYIHTLDGYYAQTPNSWYHVIFD